jgi:hypothetical protein
VPSYQDSFEVDVLNEPVAFPTTKSRTLKPFEFTAVTASKTLTPVYEPTVEDARIELWEVDDGDRATADIPLPQS